MENLKNTALLERLEIKRKVGVLIHVHSSDPTKLSQPDSLTTCLVHGALSLDSAVLATLQH